MAPQNEFQSSSGPIDARHAHHFDRYVKKYLRLLSLLTIPSTSIDSAYFFVTLKSRVDAGFNLCVFVCAVLRHVIGAWSPLSLSESVLTRDGNERLRPRLRT